MIYYIKIHYLKHYGYYKWRDELADSYNETLDLVGKTQEVFFDEWEDDFYKGWIDYERNERYSEFFEFEWYREIWDSEYNIVKVNFLDIWDDEIDDFQEKFLSFLKDKVEFIYKFEDSRFLEVRKQFFEDIYKIETNLREVMSFIFFTTYYDFENFLKDLKVNDITWKLKLKQEDLRETFENEFFYISFKDYSKLLELRDLKESEKTELMKESRSFDEWKQRIFERWIKDEPYIDFIQSIKQDLEILENFRNAIMHSHSFTDKLKQNYEISKAEILKKIQNFRETCMNIFWNELGLLPWKNYTNLWWHMNFAKWKKYKLKWIVWFSDAIFEWDDGNDYVFFDKEFHEHWEY